MNPTWLRWITGIYTHDSNAENVIGVDGKYAVETATYQLSMEEKSRCKFNSTVYSDPMTKLSNETSGD